MARDVNAKQIETHDGFAEAALKLLSPNRGKSPQELADANDREQKRTISLFRRLVVGLAFGFILTIDLLGGFLMVVVLPSVPCNMRHSAGHEIND